MKKLILSFATVLAMAATTKATVMSGNYTFTSANGNFTDFTGDPSGTGATFSNIGYSGVTASWATHTTPGDAVVVSSWGVTDNTARYISFTITPSGSEQLTINSINILAGAADFNVKMQVQLWQGGSSIATLNASPTDILTVGAYTTLTYSPSGSLSLAPGAVEVRIYGTSQGANGARINFDNIDISGGSVTPVPEPTNVALVLFGCTFAGVVTGQKFLKKKI